jgi:hypothetical protein
VLSKLKAFGGLRDGALIVAPVSTLSEWENSLRVYTPSLDVVKCDEQRRIMIDLTDKNRSKKDKVDEFYK